MRLLSSVSSLEPYPNGLRSSLSSGFPFTTIMGNRALNQMSTSFPKKVSSFSRPNSLSVLRESTNSHNFIGHFLATSTGFRWPLWRFAGT